MLDPATLRKMTDKAIANKALAAEQKRLKQEAAAFAQNEANVARAAKIVSEITSKAVAAAESGESRVKVMGIKDSECEGRVLSGAAKLVWDYCQGAGLNPILLDDHDGMGIDSWTDLYIQW